MYWIHQSYQGSELHGHKLGTTECKLHLRIAIESLKDSGTICMLLKFQRWIEHEEARKQRQTEQTNLGKCQNSFPLSAG
jgi:hypothetical protein